MKSKKKTTKKAVKKSTTKRKPTLKGKVSKQPLLVLNAAKKLNTRQKRFAEQIAINVAPEKAAIAAGYSKTYARTQSGNLLANVSISQYIKKLTKKEADANGITRDYLTKIIVHAIESAKVPSMITGQEDAKAQITGAVALAKMYGLNAAEVKEEYKHTILTIKFV